MIHKRMEAKVQNLEIASDCELTPQQAEKIRVIKAHYDALAICKEDLEQMIRELGAEYSHPNRSWFQRGTLCPSSHLRNWCRYDCL